MDSDTCPGCDGYGANAVEVNDPDQGDVLCMKCGGSGKAQAVDAACVQGWCDHHECPHLAPELREEPCCDFDDEPDYASPDME